MSQVNISLSLTVKDEGDLINQIRQALRFQTVHEGFYTVKIDFEGTGLKEGYQPDGGGVYSEFDED